MAEPHQAYNLISNSVLTVAGETKGALQALKLTLRSAASALPYEKGGQEAPEAAPTK